MQKNTRYFFLFLSVNTSENHALFEILLFVNYSHTYINFFFPISNYAVWNLKWKIFVCCKNACKNHYIVLLKCDMISSIELNFFLQFLVLLSFLQDVMLINFRSKVHIQTFLILLNILSLPKSTFVLNSTILSPSPIKVLIIYKINYDYL